jgi:hypothetical protein
MFTSLILITGSALYIGFGYLAAKYGADSRHTDGRPNW